MIKKWYFCLSEASISRAHHGWKEMILAAINSARVHTELKPILLFDGKNNSFVDKIRKKGVDVIFHRVSFYDALTRREQLSPGYTAIASGAFLRVDIPLIEQDDEYVLYTDCDVLFMGKLPKLDILPEYFSCAPQTSKTDYTNDANSGVLIINVKKMRETHKDFVDFIIKNLNSGWPGCDQENYRRFYHGKWDRLPLEMNWKPYWGENPNATILHWHGPKPEAILNKIVNKEFTLYQSWETLYSKNKFAYEKFLKEWDRYTEISLIANYEIVSKHSGFIDKIDHNNDTTKIIGWSYLLGQSDNPVFHVKVNDDLQKLIDFKKVDRPDVKSHINDINLKSGFEITINRIDKNSCINIVVNCKCNEVNYKEKLHA